MSRLLSTGFLGPHNEPCCGPSAVATLAGRPFPEVMATFRKLCGYGPRWKGRSYRKDRLKVLAHYGVNMELRYLFNGRRGRSTLTTWSRLLAPGRTYLIDVTGHTFLYRDGLVLDQVKPEWLPVAQRRFRTSLVRAIYRVA